MKWVKWNGQVKFDVVFFLHTDVLLLYPHRSIGVLTYVMLTGESPFLGEEKQETFMNISQVNVDYSQDVFQGISDLAVDFIQSLLLKNPR